MAYYFELCSCKAIEVDVRDGSRTDSRMARHYIDKPCDYSMQIPEYWWASVGGNPSEPVIVSKDGIFTLGCLDPHPPAGIKLIKEIERNHDEVSESERIKLDEEFEQERLHWLAYAKKHPGYRTFKILDTERIN